MQKTKICIIGLGYVGLPLAFEFSKKYEVVGFDIDNNKIKNLKKKIDVTGEIQKNEINKLDNIFFTSKISNCENCNIFIITVPTPIYKNKFPDLSFLKRASKMVGTILKKNDLVIYESTTYPGCTEEICVPIIEKNSKLLLNKDFSCGYSPERVNPSDKIYKIPNINKIVSGSSFKATNKIFELYKKIIKAKVIKVSSIKVAEAAKVIENTQRDINIAFMNELFLIFDKMKINTNEVLKAASSKWNFINFTPGLVGGHCIGVDPYYLNYKAKKIGIKTKIIPSGRKINDNMGNFISRKIFDLFKKRNKVLKKPKILILGITFKEDCNDFRNSKVFDIIANLKNKSQKIDIYDPVVNKNYLKSKTKLNLINKNKLKKYDIIFVAVGHRIFKKESKFFIKKLKANGFIYDFKNIFKKNKDII